MGSITVNSSRENRTLRLFFSFQFVVNWASMGAVKPAPPPHIPGNTDAERFDNAVRKMFSVTKSDLAKQEMKWKRGQARKKRVKKAS